MTTWLLTWMTVADFALVSAAAWSRSLLVGSATPCVDKYAASWRYPIHGKPLRSAEAHSSTAVSRLPQLESRTTAELVQSIMLFGQLHGQLFSRHVGVGLQARAFWCFKTMIAHVLLRAGDGPGVLAQVAWTSIICPWPAS